ncbi:MAG: hypothetical protein Q8P41_19560 [Pseudomonadota bacterium]|nr:hypothetical protein [Pseudomonadota bacterium]
MSIVLLLTACTTMPVLSVQTDANAAAEPTDSSPRSAVSAAESSLTLTFPADVGGFYEVRSYRLDEDGAVSWVGTALSIEAITADTATVTLPAAVPLRDRGSNPDDAVVYAIALRAEDADGDPGVYTGLSRTRVVYIGSEPPEGASEGWNLVSDYDGDTAAWLAMEDGLTLDENLTGGDTITLGGGSVVDVAAGTHLALATGTGVDAVSAYDLPISPDWSFTVPGAPLLEALTESDPVEGSILAVYAYADSGDDNTRTDESILGEACFGTNAVSVTWYAYAYDLPHALALQQLDARAGWDLTMDAPEGPQSIPADDYDALTLTETCG